MGRALTASDGCDVLKIRENSIAPLPEGVRQCQKMIRIIIVRACLQPDHYRKTVFNFYMNNEAGLLTLLSYNIRKILSTKKIVQPKSYLVVLLAIL